jgi:hypothetical protein
MKVSLGDTSIHRNSCISGRKCTGSKEERSKNLPKKVAVAKRPCKLQALLNQKSCAYVTRLK